MNTKVYLEKRDCFTYPTTDDYFSPHVFYPEYPFSSDTISTSPNEVYDMVRTTFFGLGLDIEHYGSKAWNPLGEYVQSGARILIKPNFVTHINSIGGLDCTVTHPSVIRCIIDYCVIAGAQVIEVGDAPIQSADFNKLMNIHGYNRLFDFIRGKGINLLVTDFRVTISQNPTGGLFLQTKNINIDSSKVVEFDLENTSHFNDLPDGQRYRIVNYHDDKLNNRHNKHHHKYLITKSIFDADLVINLPKPKTHRFAGLTGAQKNFIGMCSDKEYLPHYRVGTSQKGGDETNFSSAIGNFHSFIIRQRCKCIEKKYIGIQFLYWFIEACINSNRLKKIFPPKRKRFFEGRWHGNDTIWRTILDLNLILLYGTSDGILNFNTTPRNVLSIGDLIIAGEKMGPLQPSPKSLGIILGSTNCTAFDYVFSKITGFDYNIIPTVKNSIHNILLLKDNLDDICLNSNLNTFCNMSLPDISFPAEWNFIPNPAWDEVL